VGNFRGRKLSRIGENIDNIYPYGMYYLWWKIRFSRRKLLRIAACAAPKYATPQIWRRKLLRIPQNRKICESFLLWKYPAIQYTLLIKLSWRSKLSLAYHS